MIRNLVRKFCGYFGRNCDEVQGNEDRCISGRENHSEPGKSGLLPAIPNVPIASDKDLHLYFGFKGQIPIGIDNSIPSLQSARMDDHLRWAEILIDAGIFYQAQQQLDLLSEQNALSAKANWLRSRLKMIKLRNAIERSNRGLEIDLLHGWTKWPTEIENMLDAARKISPEFGPAWLTAAQFYLDPISSYPFYAPRSSEALECAKQAQNLIGDTPAVLLALGKAFRGSGSPSEALAALDRIPEETDEHILALNELELAKLEASCQSAPIDVEAHLRLGRWYLRHDQRGKAEAIFQNLLEQCPNRAEGYYGLARLIITNFKMEEVERLTEAYKLCHEALDRNSNFGLAYELLGTIFSIASSGVAKVDFPIESSMNYYQLALKNDPTCDKALWAMAKYHIDRGELQPAFELLERAAALDTNEPMVYFTLAFIYMGKRQFEKQEWAYSKAKELSPDTNVSSYYENKILELCGFEY